MYLSVIDENGIELGRAPLETVMWKMYVADDGSIGVVNKDDIEVKLTISGTPKNARIRTSSVQFVGSSFAMSDGGPMNRDGTIRLEAGSLQIKFR